LVVRVSEQALGAGQALGAVMVREQQKMQAWAYQEGQASALWQ
jgi:hypothetical protein